MSNIKIEFIFTYLASNLKNIIIIMVEENENNCVICLDKIDDIAHINCCSHKYCYKCIKKWSDETNKCPQCKKKFTSIKRYTYKEEKNKRKKIEVIEIIKDKEIIIEPNFRGIIINEFNNIIRNIFMQRLINNLVRDYIRENNLENENMEDIIGVVAVGNSSGITSLEFIRNE